MFMTSILEDHVRVQEPCGVLFQCSMIRDMWVNIRPLDKGVLARI